jgi:2-C-methyl-D-erythritol 2,4-cyclodiphosphate synthase
MAELRLGLGFDSHPRDEGRPLLLAGVRFEGEAGLAGHSDGDVVCHALADALLGSAALGDLGQHFPDTDPQYRGIGGVDLLLRAVALLRERDLIPVSCDLVLLAESPLIGDRREEMRSVLATALGMGTGKVSLKASRPEGLGLRGDGAGCLALAVVGPREP